ncbi:MAG TPA: flagellar biosynthesis protein FlhB [Pedomonas sp.]|uniref:flagellar biosynthesis protein FlhB n=1 Tax=Pedomonas sp. TaxID=2976421 RepID=UPI002F4032C9
MAEGSSEDEDQKTEEPTQRKLDEARKKGQISRSQEMRHVAMLGGALVVVAFMTGSIASSLGPMFTNLLGQANTYQLDDKGAENLVTSIFANMGLALLAPLALLFLAAVIGGMMQGRPTISWERVKPQWSKLNPLSGLKRMFGMQSLVEFLKTLAKCAVVGIIGVAVVWPYGRRLETTLFGSAPDVLALTTGLIIKLLMAVVIIVTVIAMADFVYQRFAFMKKMRMSRQELKDEFKQSEGDPHVKARIRQIRLERSRKRMMSNVPTADVVITNPTHFAVALKYDQHSMGAPQVVAKGVDSLALRIRAVATENKVPIVENPPLARALYASVEVDEEVKSEHYKAVAEVISYVMKLRGQRPPQRQPRS